MQPTRQSGPQAATRLVLCAGWGRLDRSTYSSGAPRSRKRGGCVEALDPGERPQIPELTRRDPA
eukprot:5475805-Lingulodinium_polyedra.AAC.1